MLSLTATLQAAGEPYGRLHVMKSLAPLERSEALMRSLLYGGVTLSFVSVLLLLNLLLSRIVLVPVRRVHDAMARAATGDLRVRLPVHSRDEVSSMAESFNRMVGELEASHQQIEGYSRNLESMVEARTAELRASEAKILASQRLEAWKEAVERVIHEIKNPLTPVGLAAETLKTAWARDRERFASVFPSAIDMILGAVRDLKELIGEFSRFSRLPAMRTERLDPNALVLEALSPYTRTPPEEVEVEVQLAAGRSRGGGGRRPDQARAAERDQQRARGDGRDGRRAAPLHAARAGRRSRSASRTTAPASRTSSASSSPTTRRRSRGRASASRSRSRSSKSTAARSAPRAGPATAPAYASTFPARRAAQYWREHRPSAGKPTGGRVASGYPERSRAEPSRHAATSPAPSATHTEHVPEREPVERQVVDRHTLGPGRPQRPEVHVPGVPARDVAEHSGPERPERAERDRRDEQQHEHEPRPGGRTLPGSRVQNGMNAERQVRKHGDDEARAELQRRRCRSRRSEVAEA